VIETTASFLDIDFDASPLVGADAGLAYVRGFFDAEGGMPHDSSARLYFQLCQKNYQRLDTVKAILSSWGILSGRIHNPSWRADPNYWRLYVASQSHQRFMWLVGSWHPSKRQLIQTRMKI
jgi:intein/homing endonuclease